MFLDKLIGLSPERVFDFVIEVQLGINSISIPLYQMALAKFKELEV